MMRTEDEERVNTVNKEMCRGLPLLYYIVSEIGETGELVEYLVIVNK